MMIDRSTFEAARASARAALPGARIFDQNAGDARRRFDQNRAAGEQNGGSEISAVFDFWSKPPAGRAP
jgi:hypothetical protein